MHFTSTTTMNASYLWIFLLEVFVCILLPYGTVHVYDEILVPYYLHLTSPTIFLDSPSKEAI